MTLPNWTQVSGIIRHLMTSLGGVLASKGIFGESDIEAFAGAAAVLIGFAWSYFAKEKKAT